MLTHAGPCVQVNRVATAFTSGKKTVVFYGGGTISLELAGDLRTQTNRDTTRIVILVRNGKVSYSACTQHEAIHHGPFSTHIKYTTDP